MKTDNSSEKYQRKALVSGATSGIGRALVLTLLQEGYRVAAIGRRRERLEELKAIAPDKVIIYEIDLRQIDGLPERLSSLLAELGGLDLCVVNAGIGRRNPDLHTEPELETIAVNVTAFVAMATWAADVFLKQGSGHLVGLSSVAAFWGNSRSPAYNASKAFELRYLQGLNSNLREKGICVTDVRPGYVATEMTAQNTEMFWVATPERAAELIFRGIERKKRVVYVTRRWRFIAWAMRLLPYHVYRRLMPKR